MKGLPNEALDEDISDGSLDFAVHIDEREDFIDVLPDEGPDVAHDGDAVDCGLDRQEEHLEGPYLFNKYILSNE